MCYFKWTIQIQYLLFIMHKLFIYAAQPLNQNKKNEPTKKKSLYFVILYILYSELIYSN